MTRRTELLGSASQAALALGLALAVQGTAQAQTPAAPAPEAPALRLPQLEIEGQEPANVLRRGTGNPRMPGTIQETPQTMNVVPREILEQQNVTTLDQALRNVPGITASIGEGNGGVNGDQFRIRGFTSQNDVYVDGLRDFGTYTRDAFNYDSVTVLKGPSATTFGQNTVGGVINVITRTPQLGSFYAGSFSIGMSSLYRGTIDINQQVNETTAVRLNAMAHYNRTVDRDNVDSGRWAIAPSIAFGLGTNTTLSVEYMHFQDNRTPDYGVPVVTPPGSSIGRPVTEFGVPRQNWYGTDLNRDDVVVDRVTARLKHEATDWLTLYNDTRFSYITRDFGATAPSCPTTTPTLCTQTLFGPNPRAALATASGPGPFHQETWGLQNVTTAVARFTTGPFRHEATLGLDAWIQNDERTGFAFSSTRSPVSLFNPSHSAAGIGIVPGTGAANRETQQRHLGFFLTERFWLTPQLSVIGGVRVSNYDITYKTYGTDGTAAAAFTKLSSNNTFADPRASLVWEPTPNQTYYFSYATSSSPPGSFITTQPATFTGTSPLEPERITSYEIGAKIGVLNNRLGLYGALYRIEKGNALMTDPATGDVTQSGDQQRNQGVELGVTGLITNDWMINANYTYMDSETTRSQTAGVTGRRVQFVPRHAASLWTTYEFLRDTPYQFTLGGGITWRSQVFINPANTAEVPSNFTLDALLSHNFGDRKQWRASLNAYNLTNELNYDNLFANRVNPSAGRTFIASLSFVY
ncbi:TonB-dependent siderophore receptor [Siccirubricoccus sp. KC 17139]|uniref:TonB-dependent siderophore receptor n=1 Tax=Siccirubricoccus soli TaxID=2899147 RepID=A0ABT1D5V2_9PROT|nr:TonB-dependent siderophore receptor [Siccirubricoccus soli]MCO6416665.1 TonB-dependent siderophore receptor [Siccirubricoccus soli]MCP2682800.1 TonB-dependent siderophore receptor [Siccirubricoccus soli]